MLVQDLFESDNIVAGDTHIKRIIREVCRELVPPKRFPRRSNRWNRPPRKIAPHPGSALENFIYYTTLSPIAVNHRRSIKTWSLKWSFEEVRRGHSMRLGPANDVSAPPNLRTLIPLAIKMIIERVRKADLGLIGIGLKKRVDLYYNSIPIENFEMGMVDFSESEGSIQFQFDRTAKKLWNLEAARRKAIQLFRENGFEKNGTLMQLDSGRAIVFVPTEFINNLSIINDSDKKIGLFLKMYSGPGGDIFKSSLLDRMNEKSKKALAAVLSDETEPLMEEVYFKMKPIIEEAFKDSIARVVITLDKRKINSYQLRSEILPNASEKVTAIFIEFKNRD